MLVNFECYSREFNGKRALNKNISKNALFYGFLDNPRPLYNSNMAKVFIVKRSRKWIFVYGSAISGIPKYFENCRFQCNFKIWGWPKKGRSVHKNQFLRPLYNRYFCHITIVKLSWIIQKSIKKCVFWDIFILDPFSIKFPTATLKIYQHRNEKSYRGSRDSCENGMTMITTWEGVEVATMQSANQTSPYCSAELLLVFSFCCCWAAVFFLLCC